MSMVTKNSIELYIRAKSAETGPPLGTVLGNLGINTVKFCNEFNEFTKDLFDCFLLRVKIYVKADKSFLFFVYEPPLFSLINLLVKNDIDTNDMYITSDDLVKLAIFKFSNLTLEKGVLLVYSRLRLRDIKVYD